MSVNGDELDSIEMALGSIASTTGPAVNMTVGVTRIGSRSAR